jgi:epoxide hydrolase-like predicted phosphatase
MEIKNIIFDFGNVLLYWDSRIAFKGKYDEAVIDQWYEEIHFDYINDLTDRGEDWVELIDAQDCDQKWKDMAYYYLEHVKETLWGLVPGMAELIAELQANGYKIFGLTNWDLFCLDYLFEKVEYLKTFDDIVVSSKVKLIKPDPKIYELAIKQFNIVPEETVFTDDRIVNIEAAEKFGINGHLFTTAENLRKYLSSVGVKCQV